MDWRVPLSDLDFGEGEEQAVREVLHSRWLTMGEVTQAFEDEFAAALGVKHAVAVANATVALHLACRAVGLKPGTEALVPSLTFVATANAVLYTGAAVRFVDILGPGEPTIDPAGIEASITPRTRAVVVMHYAGFPCRIGPILEIANRRGLAVIEDAAHAPGVRKDGKSLGAWGAAGCFSFFSNKNLVTGEGGMLVTDSGDLAAEARLLRSHGMTSLTLDRHRGHAYSYDVTDLGYNYRLDELRAALGRVQLAKLAANNARRAALAARYRQALAGLPLELPFQAAPEPSGNHIFPVLLPPDRDRRAFIDRLRAAGVQTSIHYPPVHRFSYYRGLYPGLSLPETEAYAAREVTLPLYPTLREEDLGYVVDAVREALE